MKRIILLIIGVIVAGIAMGQVNGNFKSVRVINSDSTHGVIPGTLYRGSDLILRWVDEAGVIHRFIKPTALGFWPLTGTGTFTGNVTISGGGSRTLTFNNMSALNMIIDNAVTISSSSSTVNIEGEGGSSVLAMGLGASLSTTAGQDISIVAGRDVAINSTGGNTILGSSTGIVEITAEHGDVGITANDTGNITMNSENAVTITPATTLSVNLPSSATGDTYYRSAGGFFTRRAIGTSNQFMTVSGGLPVWSTPLATTLNMSTARILGRTTASTGAVEEITVGSGLSLSGGSLTATGSVSSATTPITFGGGVISTEMNTSRMIGRTTGGVGAFEEITVGTGLSLSAGTLSATGTAPSLTSTFIGYGDGSNLLTGTSNLTWVNSTEVMTIGNSNGLVLVGDASNNRIISLDASNPFNIAGGAGGATGGALGLIGGGGSATGGAMQISGGSGASTQGGAVTIQGGGSTSGTGGSISLITAVTGTDNTITINVGTSDLIFTISRTSCAGAPTGAVANIAGVLNICP